jgi:hypothetical protein
MKTIIESLFSYHEFKKIKFEFGSLFFKNIEDNIRYYWLVVEVEILDSSLILIKQDSWFDECKDVIKDKDFDKNTSLLIISKRENSEIERQNIFKIEEDPFQFKKYVLTYTDDSLVSLKSKIEEDNSESLLNLLVDESIFNEYKESHQDYSWHNLLYNIAHKLPFLKINVAINQNLENLFAKSKDELVKRNLTDFFDSFNEVFSEEILENVDKMNEDELIILLNFNKDNGN